MKIADDVSPRRTGVLWPKEGLIYTMWAKAIYFYSVTNNVKIWMRLISRKIKIVFIRIITFVKLPDVLEFVTLD